MNLYAQTLSSPVGDLLLLSSDTQLYRCDFTDPGQLDKTLKSLEQSCQNSIIKASNSIIEMTIVQFNEYFRGERRIFDLPLHMTGTEFQKKVWTSLTSIPYGETRSYQDIAEAVGNPKAVRAVGSANGANPIAIIVPCHRVINHNGKLGGYGGGLDRKIWLLNLEADHR